MQSDADVLNKISELEAAYTEQKGITVGTQVSSDSDGQPQGITPHQCRRKQRCCHF